MIAFLAACRFFLTTVWFHAIRLILGMPRLPRKDFSKGQVVSSSEVFRVWPCVDFSVCVLCLDGAGLPKTGRTILSYCLLSKQQVQLFRVGRLSRFFLTAAVCPEQV